MAFATHPEQTLKTTAADLRSMQCTIFYKNCQHVETESNVVLIGVPITIGEEYINRVMSKELREVEKVRSLIGHGNWSSR